MSVSLQDQLRTLLLCLGMGLGVGLLYDLLRQVRLALPWQWVGGALDLLFWAGAWGCLFFCGIVLGGGRVRLYIALCLALGAAVYFWRSGGCWPGWQEDRCGPCGGSCVFSRLR